MKRKASDSKRRQRAHSTRRNNRERETSQSNARSNSVESFLRRVGNQAAKSLLKREKIPRPDSPAEWEADRTAKAVMQQPNAGARNALSERHAPGGTNLGTGEVQQLAESERSFFESRFGYDFEDVRVHTGPRAQRAVAALRAQAFTVGRDIVLGERDSHAGSLDRQQLLAHELAHVVQQGVVPQVPSTAQESEASRTAMAQSPQHVRPRTVLLRRDPDLVHEGYYTFYLTQGRSREFAVQFHYPGSGREVSVKVAHDPSTTMREGTVRLPASATFDPAITVEGPTITLFDLDGDGEEEIAIQAIVDDYHQQFLTEETTPNNPSVESYDLRDVYLIATWPGDSLALQVKEEIPEEVIAPPIWQMRSHPHPNIGMVYINTRSNRYVIPPRRMPSLSSTAVGPPPFFHQQRTLQRLRGRFQQQTTGGEAVADPFAREGAAEEGGLTPAHEALHGMQEIEHEQVPEWGAMDVATWLTTGGRQYLLDYKDRWVRSYRKIIRAAADTYDLPRVLLAGVAYTEVGGDPTWIDDLAYGTRRRVPFLTDPLLTSIAPMSLQVRRAAEELGYEPERMTTEQLDAVIESLQDPQQAVFLAAKHLASLRDVDFQGKGQGDLTEEEMAVIAKRYNQGPDVPLAQIRLNLDYGIAILRRGEHLLELLSE